MEILTGDIVRLKKKHPCGSFDWEVLRSGDYPIGDEIRSVLEVSSEQLRKFYIIIMKKSACFALFFMVN